MKMKANVRHWDILQTKGGALVGTESLSSGLFIPLHVLSIPSCATAVPSILL